MEPTLTLWEEVLAMEFTERRQAICTFLAEFKAAHGYALTIRQIGAGVALASTAAVMDPIPPHLINREFKRVWIF